MGWERKGEIANDIEQFCCCFLSSVFIRALDSTLRCDVTSFRKTTKTRFLFKHKKAAARSAHLAFLRVFPPYYFVDDY